MSNIRRPIQNRVFLGVTYSWAPALIQLPLIILYHRINPSAVVRLLLYIIAVFIVGRKCEAAL
jgi:phage shock protein PspC (stress-responsive transcriptional regulator)